MHRQTREEGVRRRFRAPSLIPRIAPLAPRNVICLHGGRLAHGEFEAERASSATGGTAKAKSELQKIDKDKKKEGLEKARAKAMQSLQDKKKRKTISLG